MMILTLIEAEAVQHLVADTQQLKDHSFLPEMYRGKNNKVKSQDRVDVPSNFFSDPNLAISAMSCRTSEISDRTTCR